MVQDVVFHTECCTDVVLLDQLGGVHPEGLGEFADRAPLGRHLFVGLQVEHSRGAHVCACRQFAVREKTLFPQVP